MPRAKKTVAAVEAAETKVEATAEAAATKKTPAKKTATRKSAAKKTTAAKTEAAKVVIQYGDGEAETAALVAKAKASAGVKTAKQVDVYVKPEVNRVYYVIDGDKFGDFALFE